MATKVIPYEDIEKQNYYMQCVRDVNLGKAEKPIACIKTFGCQMNEHDSEKIAGMVERMGYRIVPDEIEGKPVTKIGAQGIVNAENLYTFCADNYRGFDPAGITPDGVQWWNYPLPRSVMFGVNVGF